MTIQLTCPSCSMQVMFDEGLQSATCPMCAQWLHSIECSSCHQPFVTLGDRTQRCPRCGSTVRFASAKLRTLDDARDAETGSVAVVERRRPVPLTATRLPPRSGWGAAPHAVPRFLAGFFLVVCWIAIIVGVIATAVVDSHLSSLHDSGDVIFYASVRILASTAVSAAIFAFFSYALWLLLEILDRLGPAGRPWAVERTTMGDTAD